MFRLLVVLIVGVVIGYFLGFGDGRTHDQNVVQRIVERTGGSARSGVSNDVDARIEKGGGR